MIPKTIESYYRVHSKFYDSTRWAFLFGRNSISKYFPTLTENTRILDLGCGTGKHLEQLRKKYPNSRITGVDLSPDMLRFVNHSIVDSVEIINEYYSPNIFPEDEFDLIVCSYSITMMDDTDSILNTIKQHLKPSGRLLVLDFDSTPFAWFSKWMKKNHVSFESNLFVLLSECFDVEFKKTRKGWFGLYTYSFFLGVYNK